MGTVTAVHSEVRALLVAAGIDADFGPRTDTEARSVTIWPTAGVERYTRISGAPSDRADRVDLLCTGPTVLDALAVCAKVRAALAGRRLTAAGGRGGTLAEDSYTTAPLSDVGADPQRVSYPLSFVIITKGIR